MPGQRVWFDAGQKGMVHRSRSKSGCLVVFQTGNWVPTTNLAEKKTNLATKQIWREQRIGAPKKTI